MSMMNSLDALASLVASQLAGGEGGAKFQACIADLHEAGLTILGNNNALPEQAKYESQPAFKTALNKVITCA